MNDARDTSDYLTYVGCAAKGSVTHDEVLLSLLSRTNTDLFMSVLSDGPPAICDEVIAAIDAGIESVAAEPSVRHIGLLVCDHIRDHFMQDVEEDVRAAIMDPEDHDDELRRADERERAAVMNRELR